jgi:hypothetical protein
MHKLRNIGAVALATALPFIGMNAVQAAPCSVPSDHLTIQSAVDDPTCDIINVGPGVYNENVLVTRSCEINGAQSGGASDFATRNANPSGESVVSGTNPTAGVATFTIAAASVTIDGFTIKDSVSSGAAYGVQVNGNGSGSAIVNNIIDGINSPDTGGQGTAQAVYILGTTNGGADNINIANNEMKNVHSNGSAKGVLIGDNGFTNASQNVTIANNSIHDITSDAKGAYGVSVARVPNVSGLKVDHNTFDKLTGGWVHGVGLEGDTPGAMITGNDFSNFTAGGADQIAVWFESNPSFASVTVRDNNFYLTVASFGVAVQPTLTGGPLDATCNWWNSPTGPTIATNPGGTGTKVGSNITYNPWLILAAPYGQCFGGNVPATAAQCKGGGWMTSARANGTAFKNQGDCIQYINTGK